MSALFQAKFENKKNTKLVKAFDMLGGQQLGVKLTKNKDAEQERHVASIALQKTSIQFIWKAYQHSIMLTIAIFLSGKLSSL